MITFYPGPSKVYPAVADYAAEAVRSGVVSLNHRSAPFMTLVSDTLRLLHEKLAIPPAYHIALVSSATECWEIVAQSLTTHTTLHHTNGAFGEKWEAYAHRIRPADGQTPDLLCLVHNETSNGTQLPEAQLRNWRQTLPAHWLIAVDAVSSMAGIELPWEMADVWFASVQKCFGLPAGLAVLIYSPAALERATAIAERAHYNSLLFIHENFSHYQTPFTPNGLGIYCLKRVLEQLPPIAEVAARIQRRAADWYRFFEQDVPQLPLQPLIKDPLLRSATVIALEGTPDHIRQLKDTAQAAGLTLGSGYGHWKETTVRLANFPAITDEEIRQLNHFLHHWQPKSSPD